MFLRIRGQPLQLEALGVIMIYNITGEYHNRRLGGGAKRLNREIVSFRSCVRARGDCQVGMSLKRDPGAFPFPFSPRIVKWEWASNVIRALSLFPFHLGRLSLFPWDPPPPPKLLSSFSWLYRYVRQ